MNQVSRTVTRYAALLVAALAASISTAQAQKENYPARPLRLITGFLPGGVSDAVARATGEKLGERLGQRVVIDGRPGAGGLLSMELAANATPDGYTLYLGQPIITISPNFKRKPSVDPMTAFAPVSLVGIGATMLVVNPATPINSVKDLIAYGKARPPGTLRFGHSGQGSTNHLSGELFSVMSGVQLTSIPYKGAAINIIAVISGEIQISFLPMLAALPHVKTGRLRAIGVTGAKRSPAAPDVPTVGETIPGYEVPAWYGIVVPANTPPALVDRLNRELKAILQMPDFNEKLSAQGVDTQYTTVAEFSDLIRKDAVRWAKLIKDTGIVLE